MLLAANFCFVYYLLYIFYFINYYYELMRSLYLETKTQQKFHKTEKYARRNTIALCTKSLQK